MDDPTPGALATLTHARILLGQGDVAGALSILERASWNQRIQSRRGPRRAR